MIERRPPNTEKLSERQLDYLHSFHYLHFKNINHYRELMADMPQHLLPLVQHSTAITNEMIILLHKNKIN